MKKKGFTLIELIVVIAILGVLMALLVPSMLGYVKKSKIQSANNNASQVVKTMNAIFTEEAEWDGFENVADGWYGMNTNVQKALNQIVSGSGQHMDDYVGKYEPKVSKMTFAVYIKDGVAVAAAAQSGKYYGVYPFHLTNANYDSDLNPKTLDGAVELAEKVYLTGNGAAT